jgi:hypothetical protein
VETELREAIAAATPRLLALTEKQAATPREKGKWSPKQIIGHLIDSASNNHQRFVRAQFTDDLIFPGYEQVEWVSVQDYQAASWPELVAFWRLFNLHIARVMDAIPEETRFKLRARHNLDELASKAVPKDQPVTLEYFMNDYVGHLKHHLRQVLGWV